MLLGGEETYANGKKLFHHYRSIVQVDDLLRTATKVGEFNNDFADEDESVATIDKRPSLGN